MAKGWKNLDSRAVSIARDSMDLGWAEAFGFILKLGHGFMGAPILEVFLDSEEARARNWREYGTLTATAVRFTALNERKEIELSGRTLSIEYTGMSKTKVDYPKRGPVTEPVYEFMVSYFYRSQT